MGRIAAIDFGLKRIGLAISDSSKKIALPKGTIPGGTSAIENLRNTLPLNDLDLFLVGLPLEMSGKKGPMALMVEQFGKELELAFKIPVKFIDERLSSKSADVHLREISLKRKERSAMIDSVAAVLLLQMYLDIQ